MSALYLEALRGNAASLSVLMAGAWVVQQPAGNSGRVDGIWPFRSAWSAPEAPYGRSGAPRPMPGKGAIATASCASAGCSRRRHDPDPDGAR